MLWTNAQVLLHLCFVLNHIASIDVNRTGSWHQLTSDYVPKKYPIKLFLAFFYFLCVVKGLHAGRLASSIVTKQCSHLTLVNFSVKVIQSVFSAVFFAQVMKSDANRKIRRVSLARTYQRKIYIF